MCNSLNFSLFLYSLTFSFSLNVKGAMPVTPMHPMANGLNVLANSNALHLRNNNRKVNDVLIITLNSFFFSLHRLGVTVKFAFVFGVGGVAHICLQYIVLQASQAKLKLGQKFRGTRSTDHNTCTPHQRGRNPVHAHRLCRRRVVFVMFLDSALLLASPRLHHIAIRRA
jgi:hypothetical protein